MCGNFEVVWSGLWILLFENVEWTLVGGLSPAETFCKTQNIFRETAGQT